MAHNNDILEVKSLWLLRDNPVFRIPYNEDFKASFFV